jgi:hypothetical protein
MEAQGAVMMVKVAEVVAKPALRAQAWTEALIDKVQVAQVIET